MCVRLCKRMAEPLRESVCLCFFKRMAELCVFVCVPERSHVLASTEIKESN